MEKKKLSLKDRKQIEQEVSKAQHKLMQIFLNDIEEKMNEQPISNKEHAASESNAVELKKVQAYNKFNDEEYEVSAKDLTKLVSKDAIEEEKKKSRGAKYTSEDPVVKTELAKHNYKDLIELNRDFNAYMNYPEKFRKINKARLKRHTKKRSPGEYEGDAREGGEYGLLAQSRDIMKSIEQSRAHGFMSQKERRKVLKNLF